MKRLWLSTALMFVISFLVVQVAMPAETVPAGQKIFLDSKCNSCHSLKAAKIEKKKVEAAEGEEAAPASGTPAKKPPDLSGTGLKHTEAWIEGWLMKKELLDGKKHKKLFHGTPEELKTLATWLSGMKTKMDGDKAEGAKTEGAAPAK